MDKLIEKINKGISTGWNSMCAHENCYKGGYIWTICNDCGSKWDRSKGESPSQDTREQVYEDATDAVVDLTQLVGRESLRMCRAVTCLVKHTALANTSVDLEEEYPPPLAVAEYAYIEILKSARRLGLQRFEVDLLPCVVAYRDTATKLKQQQECKDGKQD